MINVIADLSAGNLIIEDIKYPISCNVRSLANGNRKRDEVVLSIPDGKPYDPRPFPKGKWKITAVEWLQMKDGKESFSSTVYGWVKIRTDAYQPVDVWSLDLDGDYLEETDRQVTDTGYLIHYSMSRTTLGCIRAYSPNEIDIYAKYFEQVLSQEGPIPLEVI